MEISTMIDAPLWMWLLFGALVVVLLAFDLGVLHKNTKELTAKHSFKLYGFYVAVAALHGVWVWYEMDAVAAQQYFTAYFVEQSLAMDNVFIISMMFTYFAIPRQYQHRVLFWGILSVIILRGIFIGLGAALISQFSWILYIFGAFLLFTGIKMLRAMDHKPDVQNNALLKYIRKHLNVTPELHGQRFFVRLPSPKNPEKKVVWVTPLFVCLMLIEFVDLIFAVDSIPAVFAITQNTYIVYTSNIFAILGLRTLYFALSAMIHRFTYLKYALALVLIFIGLKICLVNFIHIPALLALGITLSLLGGGVAYSLYRTNVKTA